MPRGDKTGPRGQGPKTGRGLGYCTGNKTAGSANPQDRPMDGRGRGVGFGQGRRRFFRNRD